jgi:hypothetical protein
MIAKEKARANGPIPNAVLADGLESIRSFKDTQEFARALAREVFGPHYRVVYEPIVGLAPARLPGFVRGGPHE